MNVGIPPRSLNHRLPAAEEAPTAIAASSLLSPFAISNQNSRSTSRRCVGCPGDLIGALPVSAFIHPAGLPINTSTIKVLRGPVESSDNVIFGMSAVQTQFDLAGLRARRQEILAYAAEHGARNVRVFGSTARGEAGASSDVDLLVEMEPGRNLLDLVGLWQDLEDLLDSHVDVLTDGGVSPYMRDRIFAEAVPL